VSSVPEPPPKRVEITVSVRTMATILGVAAFVWAFVAARQAVLWVFIALFLAIVLQTPVTWLEERVGMRRGNAAMLVVLGVVGALIAVPLTASVQIVVRELTAERRAAVALAHAAVPGRPDADQ